jgi:hypothetical protein
MLLLVACGGNRAPEPMRLPPPPPPADAAVVIDAPVALAAPDAPPRDCWTAGPITAPPTGVPVAAPVSTSTYPLRFTIIDGAESARRAAALHARFPSFEFHVDDAGVVAWLTTDRMPCVIADAQQVTMANQATMIAFMTELAQEMPDVPFLAEYAAQPYLGPNHKLQLSIRQVRDIPSVLALGLAAKELDDAQLLGKWAGARVQWFRPVEHQKVIARPLNKCVGPNGGGGCDQPGPQVITTIEHRLRGQKPIAARYVDSIERTTVMTRTAKAIEIRRVAFLHVNDLTLGEDLFGSEAKAQLEGQFGVELGVTPTDQRDAVTGAALPPRQR